MREISSKKELAIFLSKLKGINGVDRGLEQYQTESGLASDLLWDAYMQGDITDRIILDLGCGNGIFGIGALILGARKAIFVEMDDKAIEILKNNLDDFEEEGYEIVKGDVKDVKITSQLNTHEVTTITNPPFGTKKEHADREFLIYAFSHSNAIYSIHKAESTRFIEMLCKDNGFTVACMREAEFIIKKSHIMHKKDRYAVKIVMTRLIKR